MTNNLTTTATGDDVQPMARFTIARWIWGNALGLAIVFGLFGLVGETMEALGAEHDSVPWGVPTIAAMILGGCAFAVLRRRALGDRQRGPRWHTLAIGASITAAFVVGSVLPPIDFFMAIVAAGTIGSALQLGKLRRRLVRPRGLVVAGVGAWLVGALAAFAAIMVADSILKRVFNLGDGFDSVGIFIILLVVVGLVGGGVGGAIEAVAIRSRLARAQ